ncbi:MAG TPA: hypothetical protein VEG36_03650 [Burkholderiales bacterium]|nr:hypothetical protein [Burkholderiales bacterium]
MCHEWWDEMVYQERARIAKEQADRLKQSADKLAAPPGAKPETKPQPDRQTQPEAVPV